MWLPKVSGPIHDGEWAHLGGFLSQTFVGCLQSLVDELWMRAVVITFA
jgi:hypothetical protein